MSFKIPIKHILSSVQLEDFQGSQTHANIVTFIEELNNSVINVKLTDDLETTVRFFVSLKSKQLKPVLLRKKRGSTLSSKYWTK